MGPDQERILVIVPLTVHPFRDGGQGLRAGGWSGGSRRSGRAWGGGGEKEWKGGEGGGRSSHEWGLSGS